MDAMRGVGRVMFAGTLLMIGGVLNIVYGIAAISNSSFFTHNAHYVFADLKTWGWVSLVLGILELFASLSLIRGAAFGRLFGIFVGALVAVDALFSLPAYPFWSLCIFALSLWIIHGLAIYGDPGPSNPAR
jgi:hypothetical protein